jgi:hypothetical protein
MRVSGWAGLVIAAVIGIAVGWMDSRPGFDATGLTVALLVTGAGVCSLLVSRPGRSRLWLPVLAALLVGGWVPLFELAGPGGAASLASLLFAAVGAAGGYLAARQTRDFEGAS